MAPVVFPIQEEALSGILESDQIRELSSGYLGSGFAQDGYEFKTVEIRGKTASAVAQMTSYGISPTDPAGYHLSVNTAFLMIGQLIVIHGHKFCGFSKKEVEVWVREYSVVHRQPVRDPKNIAVSVTLEGFRRGIRSDKLGFVYSGRVNKRAITAKGTAFFDFSAKKPSEDFMRLAGLK